MNRDQLRRILVRNPNIVYEIIEQYKQKHFVPKLTKQGKPCKRKGNMQQVNKNLSELTGLGVTSLYNIHKGRTLGSHERNLLRTIQAGLNDNLPCMAAYRTII